MARDIEADVKINDKSGPGLKSAEDNVRKTGKNINKEFEKFGSGIGNGLISGIGKFSPKLAGKIAEGVGDGARLGAPLLLSGVAGALPALSGLIGAAVGVGGIGAGILAGVAVASRDARVKEAGTTLGTTLLSGLGDQAGAFVQPVLQGIEQIKGRFIELRPTLKSIFDNSSQFVAPLTDALLDVGQSLLEGIDTAIQNSGPAFDALVTGLSGTGEAIKSLIEDVTSNSEANAATLTATFDTLNGTITVLGQVLGFVNDAFSTLNDVAPLSLFTTLNELFGETDETARRTAGGVFGVSDAMQGAGLSAELAEKSTQLYEKALKDNEQAALAAADAQRSLFDDVTRVAEAEENAADAAKKNGRTLDENTKKGRANRDALSRQASAYNTVRGNMEKAGKSADVVNGTLATQRARLIATAGSMGVTGRKAEDLADQLLGIKSRNVTVTANTGKALTNVQAVKKEIAQTNSKTVTLTVNVNASRLASIEKRLARVGAGNYAAGDSFGITAAGQRARAGGPVTVNSQVAVSLDGRPFREMTATQVSNSEKRVAFRQRVGRRDDGRR